MNVISLLWYKGESLNRESRLNIELIAELQQQKAENEKLQADMTQVS